MIKPWLPGGRPRTSAAGVQHDWLAARAPVRDQDRVLLSQTHLWLRRIPSGIHPKHLCRQHPRIANRFAQCWGNDRRLAQLLDELRTDRRGGRRGFSPRVLQEIGWLEQFHGGRVRVAYDPRRLLLVLPTQADPPEAPTTPPGRPRR